MRIRLLATTGLVTLALLGATSPAGAGGPQLPPVQVTGDPVPGGTLTVSGEGCIDGEDQGEVSFLFVSEDGPPSGVGAVAADGEGAWSTEVVVSASAPVGAVYNLIATCSLPPIGDGGPQIPYPVVVLTIGQGGSTTTTTIADTTTTTAGATTTAAGAATASPRFTG
jgi:hypothetical protein